MDITRAEQIALDDALVAPANCLKIGKKMLQICPKLLDQQFKELPFEEEILTFLRDLGHSGEIKCLSGKSTGYDSLRLSQAQILWGMYHKKNVDYAYLLWEDFVYQVENKNVKSRAEPPKTKASVKKKQARSNKAPKAPKGKRLKATAKVTKPSKKKLPTQGLETLSEVALTKEEQMRIVTKRSLTQFHSSHASGSGANEGTGVTPGVLDVPKYSSDDEQISWKSSSNEDDDAESENDDDDDDADNQDDDGQEYDVQDDENQDDDNVQTDSDNDGDNFVHPKFSTHNEEDKEEYSFDLRVQTPSHVESTDDEDSDEEIQGANVEGEELDEEETNEEDKANELYRDVNVNLEGRDTKMADAPRTIIQTTQVIEGTHVIITLVNPKGQQQSSSVSSGFISNMLNPSLDTGIDSIFNLNTESTSLVDVLVTTITEPPLSSATTLPPPTIPLITHLQQTPAPTPTTVPSSSLQDLPNFGSLFRFDHGLKTLETDFSEFKQTNQFAIAVSSILGIIDAYLANKMHETVKTAVQLQSDILRDEAHAENEDFINKLDDNIKKIIKDQVKEQTSHAVGANLSVGIKSFLMLFANYALWDVIEDGNSFKPVAQTTTNVVGTSTSLIPGPVTTEEKAQKKNDVKAKSMLLMALPNEHLMLFNQYKDAKTLFATIQTRFGGNDATKKAQKTLLKQMYENFKDLSLKLLRSLPSEWNSHVVVWRNKPYLDTMSFDDLYNNFKIVKQEVKGTASSSSSLNSQNMAFVSSPSSTNEVNTAYGVISTANVSDDTVYAFLDSQPNGSQLIYEDLEQIHEDDIEEMNLKWQLALLSMRTRRFFLKTGRKITINGSDTAGYNKSKVKCFNCHKMGHFARECRGPRNQDNRNRNQDSSRRTINIEETSSKAMVAIDGAGFDWSYMADDEVPTNMALMAFSDSEVHNDKTCSKTCIKSFETLKTQLDYLRIEFNKYEFNLATYKRGLASIEEQLVFYKKNEVIFCEQLVVLKRYISYKDSELSMLKSELEKLKQEKESNQLKIKKFDNASKSLEKLIGSQIPDKSRKGLGFVSYNVVPHPPTGLFSTPNLDLSNSGLEEFQQPEFEGYRPKTSKNVSEDTSNEVRESPDASMVEKLVSDDKLEKKTVFPTVAKIEFIRPK
ncbi:ribonuclease H-like domain-containing protein [Tanacetum coccineum]